MLIILFWLLLVYINRKDIYNAILWPIIGALIFWYIGGNIAACIIQDNPSMYTKHDQLTSSWNIKSVKFDTRYIGSFVLGTGSIEHRDYYYVFTDMGNNQWLKQKFPMETTFIKEVTTEPRALAYRRTIYSQWLKTWMWWLENFLDTTESYVLEVPKGTIIEEYKP
jgi:hypothetical protein